MNWYRKKLNESVRKNKNDKLNQMTEVSIGLADKAEESMQRKIEENPWVAFILKFIIWGLAILLVYGLASWLL